MKTKSQLLTIFSFKEEYIMSKAITASLVTAIIGLLGIYLGAAINLEGYLGIIFVVASATGFIVSSLDNNKKQ